jgi:hypothetical protein
VGEQVEQERSRDERSDANEIDLRFKMEMQESITVDKYPVDYQKKLFCHA